MKIYINIFSKYKIFFFINFKIKKKIKLFIIIKNKILYYFKIKKNLFYKNNKNNLLLLIHKCRLPLIKHSFKHFIKINHNSILENKINEIF
ncbi:hypothetical protein [Candidatus Carsonella ruddii]|uniref:Uncharacterized protein n=1 Tax=Candidatus Carsonella ruddii HC isolate Thao2000 TaxID=1202538 RepID=J3TW51_CARRU|nr:hypothetical protein [Candidatus Carsonella ruddii]AFP83965.1 hypothetical protein A353_0128 [Candidatus Carsonella ruddii HC isolate Thao2000]